MCRSYQQHEQYSEMIWKRWKAQSEMDSFAPSCHLSTHSHEDWPSLSVEQAQELQIKDSILGEKHRERASLSKTKMLARNIKKS